MVVNMTHNENIKNFDEISCHLELEDERFIATKSFEQTYMAETSLHKALGIKHNRN